MAYLPPAGVRQFTAQKLTHLATMSEVPNPGYTEKMLQKSTGPKKKLFTKADLPPMKNRDGDWPPPQRPHYPEFPRFDDGCSVRCHCVQPPLNLGPLGGHIGRNAGAKDPRELPYGLPPLSYDVRRRSDWFDYWKEDMGKFSGSFGLWDQQYGEKYFYRKPGIQKCDCRKL